VKGERVLMYLRQLENTIKQKMYFNAQLYTLKNNGSVLVSTVS